jgi:hypothetical protein
MTMSRLHRSRRLVPGLSALLLVALTPAAVAHAAAGSSASASSSSSCSLPVPLRAENFSHGLRIDNRYLPWVPGSRHTYTGTTVDDTGKRVSHTVITTVTDMYKVVDGIRSRVIYDVDRNSSGVTEAELAFFAQDDRGNVWNVGEYPEEYDHGTFSGAPSTWISGQAGATGGLHMLAHPTNKALWEHEYLQGRAPRIDFLDCAEIEDVGRTVTVPAGRFTGVLTTYERSPLASTTAIQTKDHAPGIGVVRIGAINDPEGEQLQLVRMDSLSPAQLRAVDARARALDRHAYQVSKVYRATTRARIG